MFFSLIVIVYRLEQRTNGADWSTLDEIALELPPLVIHPLIVQPNPFNPQATIIFFTDQPQRVRGSVYDLRGRLVAELTDQQFPAGEHSVEWQGRDVAGRAVPSGEYFFRVDIGGRVETRKATLFK